MKNLFLEYPAWFLFLCVLVGLGYALLLYSSQSPWGRSFNRLLGTARFILISLVCFLLLGAYFRNTVNQYEKPEVVIAIDDSQSIELFGDSLLLASAIKELQSVADQLAAEGLSTSFYTSSGIVDSLSTLAFDRRSTDLGGIISGIEELYENRNLACIALLTDGLFNQGYSPEYMPITTHLHTIGIGDTAVQKDIMIKQAYANKIANLANKFPISAEIAQYGYEGKELTVILSRNDSLIEKKSITFKKAESIKRVNFLIKADRKGTQRYEISITPEAGEITRKNNYRSVYLSIIDDREKILIVAASPHPDIKALKSAIDNTKNYEVKTYIPQLAAFQKRDPVNLDDKYDLIIFHQLPAKSGLNQEIFEKLYQKTEGALFIVGGQTDTRLLSSLGVGAKIVTDRGLTDQVTPIFNNRFDKFLFDDDKKKTISALPPVNVPYGDVGMAANTEVLLYQRIGSVTSEKPLLLFHQEGNKKTGVMLGEGLWRWRLQNFALEENTDAFDELVGKLVQLVATKAEKSRFRVYPLRDEYFEGETVIFETEVYNELYERIYDQQVELVLTNSKEKSFSYSYVNSQGSSQYAAKGLPPGLYRYQATTVLDGKPVKTRGGFTIKELVVEALVTKADFNLLRNISQKSGGHFYGIDDIRDLGDEILAADYKPLIHSEDITDELLNFKWIFFILVLLATIEWVVRKLKGWY